jgi:hypothetical protein
MHCPSLAKTLAVLWLAPFSHSATLRGNGNEIDTHRQLQASPYYSTSDPAILGARNLNATLGNPLKGLVTAPSWGSLPAPAAAQMPHSLEFSYLGMSDAMVGNNMFNWSMFNKTINDAASRNNHVIWRVYIDYPGWGAGALKLPKYLMDAGVLLYNRTEDSGNIGYSPKYTDPLVLQAMEQFITAFGKQFDGHKGLAFLQLGLLGKYGEWHTSPQTGLISQDTQRSVAGWYRKAFPKTPMQVRYPDKLLMVPNAGLHDDSFAWSTLGGNNFWPLVQQVNQTSFWKTAVMGGETRPELQSHVFRPEYKPGYFFVNTENKTITYKQDFFECVNTTHATYMLHFGAFSPNKGGYQGAELANAQRAHVTMGYNFQVSHVAAVAATDRATVAVDVTVTQVGVAPFYFPLALALNCTGASIPVNGVETLIEAGEFKVFRFNDVPATEACLSRIQLSLVSSKLYSGRPIKFAQGNGNVVLRLPMPSQAKGP